MREQLTARQRQVLDAITHSLDERGFPPTLRELGNQLGIRSTNGVNDHLKALERKGYLSREGLKSRTLRPVDYEDAKVSIPMVGHLPASGPIPDGTRVTIDRFFIGKAPSREVFGLVIKGDSMIDHGIYDGDYIFVRKQSTAENGEVVVVMIDGEATCKRIFHESEQIRLQPANEAMQPIYVRRSDFRSVDVIGKVVGVYRRLA